MTYEVKQSTTTYALVFLMVDSTDHVTGKTGLTPTVTLSKNGGAFASPTGAVSEIANGWYKVAGNATDNATLGPLILHATGTAADPTDVVYTVVLDMPGVAQTGDAFARLGAPAGASVSADVAAVKSDTGSIKTKTDSLTFTVAGVVDANALRLGGTVQTARDIGASVLLSNGTGTGQLKLASGYVAMTWADVAAPTTALNLSGTTIATTQKVDVETIKTNPVVNAGTITFPSGATLASTTNITAGTITTVSGNVNGNVAGSVASVTGNVGGNVAGSVASVSGAVASVTGNVGGNVAGSVASVAGAVGSVTGLTASDVGAIKSVTDKVFTTLEVASGSPGDYRFAADALRNAPTGSGGSSPSAATIAAAVWDEPLASHLTAGSTGYALNAAGSAGDPWATAIPGAYGAGTAGKIVGDNINATISSRATQVSVDAVAGYVDTEVAAIKAKTDLIPAAPAAVSDIPTAAAVADAVWDEATSGHTSSGTTGKALNDTDLRGSRTVIRGTVGGSPTTTTMTPSAIIPAGAAADQFKGRILIFDNDTSTAALRGQATDITANSSAGLPALTFTALTTAASSGDTFSIV